MRKKNGKKISLHRETVRSLESRDLNDVVGGGETRLVGSACPCTNTCSCIDPKGCEQIQLA